MPICKYEKHVGLTQEAPERVKVDMAHLADFMWVCWAMGCLWGVPNPTETIESSTIKLDHHLQERSSQTILPSNWAFMG